MHGILTEMQVPDCSFKLCTAKHSDGDACRKRGRFFINRFPNKIFCGYHRPQVWTWALKTMSESGTLANRDLHKDKTVARVQIINICAKKLAKKSKCELDHVNTELENAKVELARTKAELATAKSALAMAKSNLESMARYNDPANTAAAAEFDVAPSWINRDHN